MTTALLEGRSPELSSGERLLDCVFAGDVAEAYVAAASAPGIEGHTIDIGRGVLTSVREVVELIVEYVGPSAGRPVFGAVPVAGARAGAERRRRRAAELLGWRATTGLEEGLRRTVAWFRDEAKDLALAARL